MGNKILKILLIVFIGFMADNSYAGTFAFFKDNANGTRTLTGHVPREVAGVRIHHHADLNQVLDLQILLPLQNQTQLTALLKGIYDPKSPLFHHFLTPDQFKQQFGPSVADSDQVKTFFRSKGFIIKDQSSNGTVLHITGSVGNIERVFGSHINYYRVNDGTMFFAPDLDPTISAQIVGKVSAVGGLDNVIKFRPHFNRIPPVKMVNAQVKTPKAAGTGPGGYLAPNDVKTAYNINAIPLISDASSLQNVALFQLDGYLASDVARYVSYFNLPSVPLQNVLVDGFSGTPTTSGGSDEVTLDIETLIGIAGRAINKIYVYETANNMQGWMDEWSKIANDNLAKIVSCSWGMPEVYSPALTFDNQIFQQMATQGQAVFAASGDSGAYDCERNPTSSCTSTTLAVDEPSAEAFLTGVGISALTANASWVYQSETASSKGGGGVSVYVSIPDYQQAMASQATAASKVSQTMRNVPDVAFTADPSTAYAFYVTDPQYGANWYGFWGSSISSPIWAAFTALVNQGRVHAGQSVVGFLNPALYPLANSSKYLSDFHDITTGDNQYYPGQAGLDAATGLGSFNGANLYNDLLTPAVTPPPVPTGVTASAGNALVILSWGASTGATSYKVKRSTVSGGPYTIVAASVTNTTYTDASVSNGTVYYYVVSAVNTAGESANSTQVQAQPVLFPSVPTGLSPIPGNNQVILSWNVSPGATSYKVKRSIVRGGPYTIVASGVTNTTYTDTSVSNGTTYYYVVSAVNLSGESANSTEVQATPALLPPSVPTGLLATPGNNQVVLSWDVSTGAASYNVKRATVSGGPYTIVASAVMNMTYTDTSVSNGTVYYYVVSAVNASGESANSTQVQAQPFLPVPAAPTGLSPIPGNNQVALSWNGSTGATFYKVKRSTVSGGPYTIVAGAVSNTTYTDTTVSNGTIYYYVVSAVNLSGESANSTQVQAKPNLPVPAVPRGLSATPWVNKVALSWNVSAGAISYNVKRAAFSGGPYLVLISGITSSTYVDTSARYGTTYYYVVSAVNSGGESANSAPAGAMALRLWYDLVPVNILR